MDIIVNTFLSTVERSKMSDSKILKITFLFLYMLISNAVNFSKAVKPILIFLNENLLYWLQL